MKTKHLIKFKEQNNILSFFLGTINKSDFKLLIMNQVKVTTLHQALSIISFYFYFTYQIYN